MSVTGPNLFPTIEVLACWSGEVTSARAFQTYKPSENTPCSDRQRQQKSAPPVSAKRPSNATGKLGRLFVAVILHPDGRNVDRLFVGLNGRHVHRRLGRANYNFL